MLQLKALGLGLAGVCGSCQLTEQLLHIGSRQLPGHYAEQLRRRTSSCTQGKQFIQLSSLLKRLLCTFGEQMQAKVRRQSGLALRVTANHGQTCKFS